MRGMRKKRWHLRDVKGKDFALQLPGIAGGRRVNSNN